jgi:hypothetical protein
MDQKKFVSKDEVKEYNDLFSQVFSEIQEVLRKDKGLTFSYRLVGSAKRRLVIRHHNQGFDCDYQLFLQRNKKQMEPKEIKDALIKEFDARMPDHGFKTCRNKKKAIEIRKKDSDGDKLTFKYDIVIMKEDCPYILHRSENNVYVWNLELDYSTWAEDYGKIKGANMWDDLRNRYYDKKIQKDNGTNYVDRKSFQILHEAVKETLQEFYN